MRSPITLVNITRIIHNTALSMPLALASRATQTNSAMFRTRMMMGTARNVLHIAQPAIPEAVSDCRARAGRARTLSAVIEHGTLLNFICMPVVKRYHSGGRGRNLTNQDQHRQECLCYGSVKATR